MRIFPALGSVALTAALSGCAALSPPPSWDISINGEVKKYTFVKTLPNGEALDFDHLGNALALNLRKGLTIEKAEGDYQSNSISSYQGTTISRQKHNSGDAELVLVDFENGEVFESSGAVHSTTQRTMYVIRMKEEGDQQIVTIRTPELARVFPGGLLTTFEPLLTEAQIKEEIALVNDQLDPKVKIEKFYTGSFDVPLSPRKVAFNIGDGMQFYIGNADWAEAADTREWESGKTFDLLSNTSTMDFYKLPKGAEMKPVLIKLAPSGSGTNIQYKFRMVATAFPDGTFDDQSKQASEYIAKIKRVARN